MHVRTLVIETAAVMTVLVVSVASAENIDPTEDNSQYAYGENVGWLNFEPNQGPGVQVSSADVQGLIWGENIGWVNLSPSSYGGVVNDGAGNLSGYAWGENVGWINFGPNNGGVTVDADGNFAGWAWGENVGWINFNSAQLFDQGVRVCKVKFDDLANFADEWLSIDPDSPANLMPPARVDQTDYAVFAWYWHDFCPHAWELK